MYVLLQDAKDDIGGAQNIGIRGILVRTGIFNHLLFFKQQLTCRLIVNKQFNKVPEGSTCKNNSSSMCIRSIEESRLMASFL